MNKFSQWISARREIDDMDDNFTIPPVATLPPALPEFSAHDEESMLVQRAAALHAQLKRSIETAQVELAESVLGRQGDQQKIGYLEKENAELRLYIAQQSNDIQTLQSQVQSDREFLSIMRKYLDARDIKAAPKPERKPRPKKEKQKEERQETDQPAETVG